MTDISNLPKGLISFTYNVNFNEEVKNMAINDLNATMAAFELNAEQTQAILNFSNQGFNDTTYAGYSEALKPEIKAGVATVW